MFRQPLRNFLLAYLLNFILKVFVITSKYFRVDIKPPEDVEPTGYKKLSPLTDPLPIIKKEKRKKDYRKILAEAEAALTILKSVVDRYNNRSLIRLLYMMWLPRLPLCSSRLKFDIDR